MGGKTFAEFLKALFSCEISITDKADVVINALFRALSRWHIYARWHINSGGV